MYNINLIQIIIKLSLPILGIYSSKYFNDGSAPKGYIGVYSLSKLSTYFTIDVSLCTIPPGLV